MNRKWGYKKDPEDKRDWKYKVPFRYALPPFVDLRGLCTPVEDQGDLGSCVAFATVGAFEYLDFADGNWNDYAQLFQYYNCRFIDGNVNEDTGSYLRTGLKAFNQYGCCTSALWPYLTYRFAEKPPQSAYDEASGYKSIAYYRIPDPPVDLTAIKAALVDGLPVSFGTWVFQNFYRIASDGILPPLLDADDFLGGHAMLIVGYDEAKQWFIVRNSWGQAWGDNGYLYMPYDYLSKFGSDFWVLQKVANINDIDPAPTPEPDPAPPTPEPTPTPDPPVPPAPDPEPRKCVCAGVWRALGLMK